MRSSMQPLLRSKGGGVLRRFPFPLDSEERDLLRKKRACFLQEVLAETVGVLPPPHGLRLSIASSMTRRDLAPAGIMVPIGMVKLKSAVLLDTLNWKGSFWCLVATIHFSPFTRSFRRIFGRLFTVFFCNGNAKFTQSLLCSLFKFTGECNHSHVHSLFTANGSSECSSIHVSVGDYQHRRKSLKANRQTDPRKGANDDAMQGIHSNHKSRE